MERLKEAGEDVLNPNFVDPPSKEKTEIVTLAKESAKAKKAAVVMTKAGVDRKITMKELKAHNKEEEPWFVVHGEVYDGARFLKGHPGGAESITLVAGEDATEDFMAIHSAVRPHVFLVGSPNVETDSQSTLAGRQIPTRQLPYRHPCPILRRRCRPGRVRDS
jgi:hypothetical protein